MPLCCAFKPGTASPSKPLPFSLLPPFFDGFACAADGPNVVSSVVSCSG